MYGPPASPDGTYFRAELECMKLRYYGDNVWPEQSEPGMQNFEQAFKE
jgi:hypothetical protein